MIEVVSMIEVNYCDKGIFGICFLFLFFFSFPYLSRAIGFNELIELMIAEKTK
jgi:hypothetical protein